ncbi:PP2C family protein-serine/threonine phosphatase [Streptomyces olivaceus]
MNAPHPAKVAGIDSTVPSPAHTVASAAPDASPVTGAAAPSAAVGPDAPGALLQDRLAGWVSDLTTLHELTERLVRTDTLSEGLDEVLRAGAALVGARRGLVVLEPADGLGPDTTVGLGLGRADLGHLETVPRGCLSHGRILDGLPVGEDGVAEPDLLADKSLDPRHREVAARLGYAASYALPLSVEGTAASTAGTGPSIAGTAASAGGAGVSAGGAGVSAGGAGVSAAGPRRLGAAVWFYDEPAEPGARPRHLAGLYTRYAAQHLARLLEVERTRTAMATMAGELLPSRLPRVSGVQLAARHRTGPLGGGDWYDALPLPDAALGLAVGSVTGSGPSAVAAMGRLRASLRAYAVMEGEDPVAVLSDLELLLRLTEPARSATALFGYCEPALRRITLAGAGHSPPLLVGERRTEFVETSVSAPLGMLACWEAPSVELQAEPGETVLLYTDGLLHRTGDPADRAFARLHAAAAGVPRAARHDPDAVAEHVLRTVLPGGKADADSAEDVVLLAVRFA